MPRIKTDFVLDMAILLLDPPEEDKVRLENCEILYVAKDFSGSNPSAETSFAVGLLFFSKGFKSV